MTTTQVAPEIFPATPVAAPKPTHYSPLKFSASDRFVRELRKRVDAYFEQTGKSKRDCWQMYLKTAVIIGWFLATYVALVFFASAWYVVLPLAVVLGLAVACIGFNIQHDGGHKAYSDKQWVNRMMALSLDFMGGSSYLWDWKHNAIHHTYPNIHGHDDDIEISFLGRLSPHQRHYSFHRFQKYYLWVLYGFLAIKWHLIDDFFQLFKSKIGSHKIPRPKGKDLAVFIMGKIVFFSMAFFIPMMFHPWYIVVGVYMLAAFVSGVVLAVVFQLAHCVEGAQFPAPVVMPDGHERMSNNFFVHQLETTVDFARTSWLACFFLGGLNFQVEHHLFHKICHIHYPALSKVVEETCREFGVTYSVHKSFTSALAAHYRWLVTMGKPDPVPAA